MAVDQHKISSTTQNNHCSICDLVVVMVGKKVTGKHKYTCILFYFIFFTLVF